MNNLSAETFGFSGELSGGGDPKPGKYASAKLRDGLDEHHAKDLGIPQPTIAAGRAAHAAARVGSEPGRLWRSKADRGPAEGRLAGEPQAHLSAVHRGWAYASPSFPADAFRTSAVLRK